MYDVYNSIYEASKGDHNQMKNNTITAQPTAPTWNYKRTLIDLALSAVFISLSGLGAYVLFTKWAFALNIG